MESSVAALHPLSSLDTEPPPAAAPLPPDWTRALERLYARPELIRLVFQPIVDLARGVVCGFESLARFPGPGTAAPDRWFAAARRHGIEGVLEAHVVRAAIAQRDELPPNCFLSLNVTPRALLLPEVQAAFLSAERLDRLVVELTEQVAIEDYGELGRALDPLREAGASIAIDDAGSGYSSLLQITALRPEFVKVDGGLVSGCHHDPAKLAVVEMLGSFASRIDAWVVAEGIEEVPELDALVDLEVPLGQGYLLGRPVDDMDEARFELGAYVRDRASRRELAQGAAVLLDRPPTVAEADGRDAIAELFLADAGLDVLAVVDARRRPTGLLTRSAFLAGDPPQRELLKVAPTAPLEEVARRAMTRPACDRFDPVVCTDVRGRYVGMVRVEKLVDALAVAAGRRDVL